MDEEIIGVFIPIVMTIVIGIVFWVRFHFRYKEQAHVQETIQTALNLGAELTPELIERMTGPKPGRDRDLRRGLVSIAIGIGFALFGTVIGEEEAVGPLIGVGLFPLLVGIAYLVVWQMGKREPQP